MSGGFHAGGVGPEGSPAFRALEQFLADHDPVGGWVEVREVGVGPSGQRQ